MFADFGADVVDADQLAREVVEPGTPGLQEITATFGRDVIRPDGRLDRQRLAGVIFRDPQARQKLNAITHPRIRVRMQEEVDKRANKKGLLVLDIPLLYETGRPDVVEGVAVVWVDRETQLRRLIERDRFTPDEAARRLASQMPLDEKRRRADHIIDNTRTPAETRRQVAALFREYLS
jgi:dephospho-CoA kinase